MSGYVEHAVSGLGIAQKIEMIPFQIVHFSRKGIFDLPLMMFADFLWPMYGLMLVAPVMEFPGGSLAVLLYRKQILADRRIPV